MAGSLRIGDMTRDNRGAVVDLWVEAWTRAMPGIDFEARRDWFASRLADFARDGTRVRVVAGPLAGQGARTLRARTPRGMITVRPRDGYIDQLAVAVAWWGSGTATALIEDARQLSPNGLWLLVNQANHRAVAFYEKAGFRRGEATSNPDSGLPVWRYGWTPLPPRHA